MKKKWNKFVNFCTKKGIPVPVIRDPKTNKPSVSLTLLVVSSGIVIFGLFNKVAKLVDGVDMNSALSFFYSSASLYFGRKMSDISNKKEN